MTTDTEINTVLRECATASGLVVVPRADGYAGLQRREDSDEADARVTVTFKTFLERPNARPLAEVRLSCEAILGAHPAALSVLIREQVIAAKRDLIAQLRATLARLEALS